MDTRARRWFPVAMVWALTALSGRPVPLTAQGPAVSGPISGPGSIFFASIVDLDRYDYIEEEYFLEGYARHRNSLAVSAGGHPFRTRLVVRRPTDPARFNGTVLLEWLNVTLGYDIDVDWIQSHEHLLRSGYAWVGVSVQQTGVRALREWSSERYGTLDVSADGALPSGELAFDIFSQAAVAVRSEQLLGGLHPEFVLATGHSQSALFLAGYYNNAQAILPGLDAFLIHGGGAPLRQDLDTKVFKVNSETDLWAMSQAEQRQADSEVLRTWEVAGSAHADSYYMTHLGELERRDFGAPTTYECDAPPYTRTPFRYAMHAAYDHLVAWVRDGTPPPTARPIELVSLEPEVALRRDELGLALGGVRLPDLEVPVALNSGRNGGSTFCRFYGTHQPFDDETLARLYPTPGAYLSAYSESVTQNLNAGFILDPDGEQMLRTAELASVGRD